MTFWTCNRYKLVVLILLTLIFIKLFNFLPKQRDSHLTETDIVKLEDDKYNTHKKDKVKVKVYYEALCPDSKHFFMKHLRPVTDKLSDFMDVNIIPYGKATTTEKNGIYYFKCQHGEEECFANKIHACSIEIIGNMTDYIRFTTCMISDNFDAIEALNRCAKEMSVDTDPISKCAVTEEGSLLLKKYGEDTELVRPKFIPTIVVNGSKKNQPALLKNFLLEICKLIDMPLPPPCL